MITDSRTSEDFIQYSILYVMANNGYACLLTQYN